jgi:hypothetical protein
VFDYILFIFIILYNTTGKSHLKVKKRRRKLVPLSKLMAQLLTSSIFYLITTRADVSTNVYTITLTAFSDR